MRAQFWPRILGSPERVFFAIALPAGLAFLVLTPPFKGADEPAHFYHAYQISEGNLVAERRDGLVGGFFPSSVRAVTATREEPRSALTQLPVGDRTFIDFRTVAPYSPATYLPQALAVGIGRLIGLPPLVLLYLGRLAGLLASLGLIYLAIRTAPMAKHVFLLIAIAPMALRQMALVSADSITNAGAFLLIAIILRLSISDAPRLSRHSFAVVPLSAFAGPLLKPAYVPLLFLFLLCPAERFGGRRRYRLAFLCLLGVSAATLALWFWSIRSLYVPQPIAPDADPARQAAFIVTHPARYALVLVSNLQENAGRYLWECLGYVGYVSWRLGWVYVVALALIALFDCGRPHALRWRAKAVVSSVLAATYVLVSTFNYLGWNSVGSAQIEFVQGRYYLPVAPLGFLLLSNRRFASTVPARRLTMWSAGLAVFAALVAVRGLVSRWYGIELPLVD